MNTPTDNKRNDSPETLSSEPGTMTAMGYDDYGDPDVLHPIQIDLPQRLPGQILIEVHATSINPIDYRLRSGEMKGLLPGGFPRIPGYDVAGVVADCADDASFKIGDRVMAFLDSTRGGAAAEYAVCANDCAAVLPNSMPMGIAAAIPLAGTTALQSLRDHGSMRSGDRVLVNGASGGVGMFAVQIAKAYGCHVDAVASAENRDFCMQLGTDHFYDYETTDFTESDERWDVIFDAAGKASYLHARDVMAPDSCFVSTEPDVKGMVMSVLTWPISKRGTVMLAKPKADDLKELIRLYESGDLKVFIDRQYVFRQISEAHRHVEHGVDHGKVVVWARDEFRVL